MDHVAQDLVRRVEAERRRVADVQLEDAMAFILEPLRFLRHRAADLVADVRQLGGLADGAAARHERGDRSAFIH